MDKKNPKRNASPSIGNKSSEHMLCCEDTKTSTWRAPKTGTENPKHAIPNSSRNDSGCNRDCRGRDNPVLQPSNGGNRKPALATDLMSIINPG